MVTVKRNTANNTDIRGGRMKKFLLTVLVCLFAGEAIAQAVDPPAGYTANHRFRKYNEGDYPSADSLNNDKDSIDAKLRRPGWTQQDSLQLHKSNKTITLVPPTLKTTYGVTFPDSLPTGAEFLWMMNATGTLSYIDRDSLGSASAAASDGSVADTLWIPIWNSANDTLPNAGVTEAEFYSSGTTRIKAYTYFRKDSLTTRLRFWGTDALVGAGSGTAKLYVNDSLLISRAFSADGDFNNAVSISHITNGTVATVKVEVVLGGGNNHAFKRAAIEVARAVVTAAASDTTGISKHSFAWLPGERPITSTSGLVTTGATALRTHVYMFNQPHPITIKSWHILISAGNTATDSIRFAVYDTAGARLTQSNWIVGSATSPLTLRDTIATAYDLPAGTYYLGWTTTDAWNPTLYMFRTSTNQATDNDVSPVIIRGYGANSATIVDGFPATLGTITELDQNVIWLMVRSY